MVGGSGGLILGGLPRLAAMVTVWWVSANYVSNRIIGDWLVPGKWDDDVAL